MSSPFHVAPGPVLDHLQALVATKLLTEVEIQLLKHVVALQGDEDEGGGLHLVMALLLVESSLGRVRVLWNDRGWTQVLEEHLNLMQLRQEEACVDRSEDLRKELKRVAEYPYERWPLLVDPPAQAGESTPRRMLVMSQDEDGNAHLYLQRNRVSEQRVVQGLKTLLQGAPVDAPWPSPQTLKDLFVHRSILESGFRFHARQAAAVLLASRSPFFLLSGGPGTGKTSVLVQMLRLLLTTMPDLGSDDVALVAPTGRAKARMQESIEAGLQNLQAEHRSNVEDELLSVRAQTLHSLLGVFREIDGPPRPLRQKVVVVDEASMMDIHLFGRLLERMPPGSRLILLGDVDQLPSVDHGAVLSDLSPLGGATLGRSTLESLSETLGTCPHDGELDESLIQADVHHRLLDRMVVLDHTYRSSADVLALAQAIRDGATQGSRAVLKLMQAAGPKQGASRALLLDEFFDPTAGRGHLHLEPPFSLQELLGQWQRAMDKMHGSRSQKVGEVEASLNQAGVMPYELMPGAHDGILECLGRLFDRVQRSQVLCLHHGGSMGTQEVNACCGPPTRPQHGFVAGEPVMATRNLHDIDLYNGDVGVVLEVRGEMRAVFRRGDRFIDHPLLRIQSHLEAAHGITVHKSQGSEYGHVLLLLPEKDGPLLTREILYTGITRAKHSVVTAGESRRVVQGMERSVIRPSAIGAWARGEDKVLKT